MDGRNEDRLWARCASAMSRLLHHALEEAIDAPHEALLVLAEHVDVSDPRPRPGLRYLANCNCITGRKDAQEATGARVRGWRLGFSYKLAFDPFPFTSLPAWEGMGQRAMLLPIAGATTVKRKAGQEGGLALKDTGSMRGGRGTRKYISATSS